MDLEKRYSMLLKLSYMKRCTCTSHYRQEELENTPVQRFEIHTLWVKQSMYLPHKMKLIHKHALSLSLLKYSKDNNVRNIYKTKLKAEDSRSIHSNRYAPTIKLECAEASVPDPTTLSANYASVRMRKQGIR